MRRRPRAEREDNSCCLGSSDSGCGAASVWSRLPQLWCWRSCSRVRQQKWLPQAQQYVAVVNGPQAQPLWVVSVDASTRAARHQIDQRDGARADQFI